MRSCFKFTSILVKVNIVIEIKKKPKCQSSTIIRFWSKPIWLWIKKILYFFNYFNLSKALTRYYNLHQTPHSKMKIKAIFLLYFMLTDLHKKTYIPIIYLFTISILEVWYIYLDMFSLDNIFHRFITNEN